MRKPCPELRPHDDGIKCKILVSRGSVFSNGCFALAESNVAGLSCFCFVFFGTCTSTFLLACEVHVATITLNFLFFFFLTVTPFHSVVHSKGNTYLVQWSAIWEAPLILAGICPKK